MSGYIKICGMTDEAAVEAALDAGADAIGFVFAKSVRQVTPARAAELARVARGRVACIAVTLHPTATEVAEILAGFAPDALQTDAADYSDLELPDSLKRLPVLRAGGRAVPPQRRVLFEGPRSGSGLTADWAEARRLAQRTELILAGGLSPENVAAAIDGVRPFGVDVSSGVESAPGRKDPDRIARFVATARRAFASPLQQESRP